MWDMLVVAAQAPALQWIVVISALAIFVWKVATSADGALMGAVFADDPEEHG
jgi:hypothetical protein